MAQKSLYTPELGDQICMKIANSSLGLKHICDDLNVPYSSVREWIYNDKHEMSAKYARAKEMQMEHMADEILDIVDDGSNDLMTIVKGDTVYEQENKEIVNRSKLRADTRKWLMSKLAPKKFGEKLDLTSGNEPLQPISIVMPDVNKG